MLPHTLLNLKSGFILCFITLIMISSVKVAAQGNLMIFPKRLVFKENQRTIDLTLANTGTDTARYSISWINYRMTQGGKFEVIDKPDPGQFFADRNVRFFPRTVTLAPNESQKVKVQLFRSNQLEEGEYRSHLIFKGIKEQKPLGETGPANEPNGIVTKLEVSFGISIPVILEIGNTPVSSQLTDLDVDFNDQNQPVLNFTILREGPRSVYGDFKVKYFPPSGDAIEVGTVKGVAIYAPNGKREFAIQLMNQKEGVDYSRGKLQLEYLSQESKTLKLATAELSL